MPKKKSTARPSNPAPLKGWKAIGDYLGIGAATAQRWAKSGMPVTREGRYTVAEREAISRWIGKEAHMAAPAYVLTDDTDMGEALKQSITAVRGDKRRR